MNKYQQFTNPVPTIRQLSANHKAAIKLPQRQLITVVLRCATSAPEKLPAVQPLLVIITMTTMTTTTILIVMIMKNPYSICTSITFPSIFA